MKSKIFDWFDGQVRCSDGIESYGRRRREAKDQEETTDSLSDESGQEVTILPLTTETTTANSLVDDITSLEATPGDSETELTTTAGRVASTSSMEFPINQTLISLTTRNPVADQPINAGPRAGQHIPIEVPLQLQLIVAPEADRIAIIPPAVPASNRDSSYEVEAANRRRPSWRSPSVSHYQDRMSEKLADCNSKSSLVAVSVVAVLLQAATLIVFYFFYRTKRSSWTKWSDNTQVTSKEPVYGIRHSGSVNDVVSSSSSSSSSQFDLW